MREDESWAETELTAHYSSLTLHRKCPQAFSYKYAMGLEHAPETSAPERDFGSWWAALRAAESAERGRKLGSLKLSNSFKTPGDHVLTSDKATVDQVHMLAERWWSAQSEEVKADWLDRIGDTLPNRLVEADADWTSEWAEERKNEQPLGVEVFWKRELPRPEGDLLWDSNADKMKLMLLGYADEIYYDTAKRIVVIRDHKTSKTLGAQTSLADMMESQLPLYAWGLDPLLKEWGFTSAQALAYDRVKSARQSQPELTKSGTLSKTVKLYSAQTYERWAQRGVEYPGLKKDGSGAGVYEIEQEVLDKLRAPAWRSQFHQRALMPVSQHLVRGHLRAAADTAADIWRTQRRFEARGEAARNLSATACRFCDFLPLCRAQMIGGPEGEYELREFGLVAKDGRKLA